VKRVKHGNTLPTPLQKKSKEMLILLPISSKDEAITVTDGA
jgi:hypothetical protein